MISRTEFLMNVSDRQHFTHTVRSHCWWNGVLCDSTERRLLEFDVGFPPDFVHVPFSLLAPLSSIVLGIYLALTFHSFF